MRSEAAVQEQIRLMSAQRGTPLWRNNNGACLDETGRMIRFGLGNDSKKLNEFWKSSDLIGVTPITIKPEHVGRVFGVFTAIEVKAEGWKWPRTPSAHETAQMAFLDDVANLGGIAAFCSDDEHYRMLLDKTKGE